MKVTSFTQLMEEVNKLHIENQYPGFKGFKYENKERRFEMINSPHLGIYEYSATVYCGPIGDVWEIYIKNEKGNKECLKQDKEEVMCQLYYDMLLKIAKKDFWYFCRNICEIYLRSGSD